MAVFLFPGRSACYPEMISRVIEAWPVAAEVVSYASRILGRDLHRQYLPDNQRMFATDHDTQIGVFLATHLHLRALEANGARAEMSLGFGLGEINHLVHIGALDFEEALRLVDVRGKAFSEGIAGAMLYVTSLSTTELEGVLQSVRSAGVVEIGVYLAPNQHVITGEYAAVEAAAAVLRERWPSSVLRITHRTIPAYCALTRSVGEKLRPTLMGLRWKLAALPYIPNVLGMPVLAYTPTMYADLLSRQTYSPVRWRESIEFVAAHDPKAVFVAVGPRSTVFDLIPNNWIGARRMDTDQPGDLAKSVAGAALELARAE